MIISKTPLRISFAGGGSDMRAYYKYDHGSVLSTAINKYIYIAVNEKFTDNIRISYSKTEFVDSIEEIEHNLVREALRLVGIKKNVDIVYMSDMLPDHEGSGLGSSSSLLVGLLNALYTFMGQSVTPEILASQACKIEIDILGHPIGKQDQYAAAYGGLNHITFDSHENVSVNPIILKDELKEMLNNNLLMFHTAINSRSDAVLIEQKANTKNNIQVLSEMVKLSKYLRDTLQQNELKEFGKVLHKGWIYKKGLASNISNPVIDKYYENAISAGALGGKILGSGGGGFLLFFCEKNYHDKVRKALVDLKEAHFEFDPEGSRIIYNSNFQQ